MKKPVNPASASALAETRNLGVRFEMIKKFGWFLLIHRVPVMLLVSIVIVIGSIQQQSFVGLPFSILTLGLAACLIAEASNPDNRTQDAYTQWMIGHQTRAHIAAHAGTGAVHRLDAHGRMLSTRVPPEAAEPKQAPVLRVRNLGPGWRPWHRRQ